MEACRRSAGGSTKLMAKPFEVVFEAAEAVEGGYDARALGYSIFTQGDDWEQQMKHRMATGRIGADQSRHLSCFRESRDESALRGAAG